MKQDGGPAFNFGFGPNTLTVWPCRTDNVPLHNPSPCPHCEAGRIISDSDGVFGLLCLNCGWTTQRRVGYDGVVQTPDRTIYGARLGKPPGWTSVGQRRMAQLSGHDPRTDAQKRLAAATQLRRIIDAVEEME